MERTFSEAESLKIITEMIGKARNRGKLPGLNFYSYSTSMFLLLYGIPTIITGGIMRFKPMLYGGILCWCCCEIIVYTNERVDLLLTALSVTGAWLIPGIVLWMRSKKLETTENV